MRRDLLEDMAAAAFCAGMPTKTTPGKAMDAWFRLSADFRERLIAQQRAALLAIRDAEGISTVMAPQVSCCTSGAEAAEAAWETAIDHIAGE